MLCVSCWVAATPLKAQVWPGDTLEMLLTDMNLQIDITQAVDDMYNFKFPEAEKQFGWLKQKYPNHPLPYFLLGLSQWWKIMPNLEDEQYDQAFERFIDQSLDRAEVLYDQNEKNPEAKFFLAAGHAFKGRLYSERRKWSKAAGSARRSLSYLDVGSADTLYGPEFLFGDGLYNYYAEWIPEHYPALKPILWFFQDGDKTLGLKQLQHVAGHAFYTRIEAQYFLMRLWAIDEGKPREALRIADYLHKNFPDNPYFHRFYARLLYQNGRYDLAKKASLSIIAKIDSGQVGYEATSGRYAAFFLGQAHEAYGQIDLAKKYYQRAVDFGQESEAYETGYFLYSLLNLGELAEKEGNKKEARKYWKRVKKYAKRKHSAHKKAREMLKKRGRAT